MKRVLVVEPGRSVGSTEEDDPEKREWPHSRVVHFPRLLKVVGWDPAIVVVVAAAAAAFPVTVEPT
jgi:hypothetical protein